MRFCWTVSLLHFLHPAPLRRPCIVVIQNVGLEPDSLGANSITTLSSVASVSFSNKWSKCGTHLIGPLWEWSKLICTRLFSFLKTCSIGDAKVGQVCDTIMDTWNHGFPTNESKAETQASPPAEGPALRNIIWADGVATGRSWCQRAFQSSVGRFWKTHPWRPKTPYMVVFFYF